MREPEMQKRPPRIATRIDAVLIDSDGGRLEVMITDLSSEGFRLQTSETLQIGERVRLCTARYGENLAEIKWAEGFEAGGIFLEPVTL
jgi:hypothetical protein